MSSLPELLPIEPFTSPVRGSVALPGSKSLTNRALLLGALCAERSVEICGALFSEDTRLMVKALQTLGIEVHTDESAALIRVRGSGGRLPREKATLFVGLAGTAARFLTALCAAAPAGVYRIEGVPQMHKRPMQGLIEALRSLGADIECLGEEGFLPVEIRARGLSGGTIDLDASASSQLLSALLMVAPLASGPVEIRLTSGVRAGYVEMTEAIMRSFNAERIQLVERTGSAYRVKPQRTPYNIAGGYAVEPDASAASYFLALPIVTGGRLSVLGARNRTDSLQADAEFSEVVRTIGAKVDAGPHGLDVSFDPAGSRRPIERNFREISDTFLTLAAISPLLAGPTRITGIAHTRKQETDRVAGIARELQRLGQEVVEAEDSLEIHPRPLVAGQTIETYHDHRFAMSFGILGCHDLLGTGRPWLTIRDPGCCAKTFPRFFELLDGLRPKSSPA